MVWRRARVRPAPDRCRLSVDGAATRRVRRWPLCARESEPDSEAPAEHARLDSSSHPASKAGGAAEALDPARVRQDRPPDRPEPRKHSTAPQHENARVHALDRVALVHDDELEHVHATPGSERSELEAMHDATRHPDEDGDADTHPNGDAANARRVRREQHERGVIAGKRAGRRGRGDRDHGRPARWECEPLRSKPEPAGGRSACTCDLCFAAPVERKARRSRVHDDCSIAPIRDRDRAIGRPAQPHANGRYGQRRRSADGGGDHRPITVNVNVAV
jgi:hypothetical protein